MIQLLNWRGFGNWVMPSIMLIVGFHFFPLAKLFSYRAHLVTGALLIALALIYPFAGSGPMDPIGCIGAGLILWGSATYGLTGAISAAREQETSSISGP
jgi:hypothetical protein